VEERWEGRSREQAVQVVRAGEANEHCDSCRNCKSDEEGVVVTRRSRGSSKRLIDCGRGGFHMHGQHDTRGNVHEAMPTGLIVSSSFVP
jgi:hypothetical protein